MRILVVGTGGVGAAAAAVAQRRPFFERMTLADLDPSRPQALVDALDDDRFAAAAVDAGEVRAAGRAGGGETSPTRSTRTSGPA
jgi:saccharopine dehydrogenase-like NADP-dependent oxidoreductase